jgi:hypothetical protein
MSPPWLQLPPQLIYPYSPAPSWSC